MNLREAVLFCENLNNYKDGSVSNLLFVESGGVVDSFLFVIDFLVLLVADEQQRGAEGEHGGAPGHSVRPVELPAATAPLLHLHIETHREHH